MKLLQLSLVSSLTSLVCAQNIRPFPGSVISSASGRVDVFFTDEGTGKILHKYHANPAAGWNKGFESLNVTVPRGVRPSATALGDQLHFFVNLDGSLVHRFWDGTQWLPADGQEILGSGLDPDINLDVTARGSNRLHVVGTAYDGTALHKYYDGTTWKPDQGFENFGSDDFDGEVFPASPTVNSWGPDRLDVVGILSNGTLLHKFWDGHQWQPSNTGWEQWGDDFYGQAKLTSWAENRLDVWATFADSHSEDLVLKHRYWDGHSLSDWETHAGPVGNNPSITHWAANRIDIFSIVGETYIYKYWDGSQWNPAPDSPDWLRHGPEGFQAATEPVVVSWGENNLNVFALDKSGFLLWQLWEGSQWLPSVEGYYILGNPRFEKHSEATMSANKEKLDENNGLRAQDPTNPDL